MQNDKPLNNKIILITGASDGIGRAVSVYFAEQGAQLILLSRSIKKLDKLYEEIKSAGYLEPLLLPMNLSTANPDHYQEVAEAIENQFGRLDGLLHNAAMLGDLTPIEYYSVDQWYTVLQTNLNAPFLLTKSLLPLLKKSDNATLAFTTCEEGESGKAFWGAYSIAKFAINGFKEVLAEELANTNIKVSMINPGIVRTNLRANAFPGESRDTHPPPSTIVEKYLPLFS